MQPFTDLKLNENIIRGKLASNHNRNGNSYLKNMNSGHQLMMEAASAAASSDQQVMINVTRGSNLQLIPLTEVLSPKNLQSPQNVINYSSMMIEHQNSIVNHLPREGVFSPPES